MLKAAKYVEDRYDAVDINLGWPQGIARKGYYGSFLLENTELITNIVRKLVEGLKVPVTCKVRVLKTEEDTIALCKSIEEAGCSILTVHGRLREHKKNLIGPCWWDIIKKVKESVSIPVFVNGGIQTHQDVQKWLEFTGWDSLMTSEAILENPAFFTPEWSHIEDFMLDFLEISEKYEEDINTVRNHLYKSLFSGFKWYTDIKDRVIKAPNVKAIWETVVELKDRRQNESPQRKYEWYHRYWKINQNESAYSEDSFEEWLAQMSEFTSKISKNVKIEEIEQSGVEKLFNDKYFISN